MIKQYAIRRHWKLVLYLSAFFLMVFIIQDIVREVVIFRNEASSFQQNLTEEVKLDVYNEVNYRYDEIEALIDRSDQDFLKHLNDTLKPLKFSMRSVNDILQSPSISELEEALVNTVQSYNLEDLEHNYYLLTMDGVQLYNGETNDTTRVNRITETDDLNRLFIESLLEQIKNDNGVSYESVYVIEDGIETLDEYILYATRIEDTNYVIATMESKKSYSMIQREYFIDKLNEYYQQDENYLYVLSMDKEILFHINNEYVGKKYDDITDVNWKNAMDSIYEFIQEHDEGYIGYRFYENTMDGNTENRTAYLKTVAEWDIIIGSSIDSQQYNYLIDNYIQDSYQSVLRVKIPIYAILIITAVMIFRFINKVVSLSLITIKQEEDLYQKFADLTSEIIIITDKKGNILFTNKIGSEVIFANEKDYSGYNIDRILGAEAGYSKLYGINDTYYVKYNKEIIALDNQKSELYIITDVTEKVRTEQKLQTLSEHDDLTELGNRRRMVQDYDKIVLPYIRSGETAYLVMVDLDNFKEANDSYGHKFGDTVLQQISKIFISSLPSSCLMYRIGGDEFVIFAMDTTKEELIKTVKDIHQTIYSYSFENPLNLGFSAGIAPIKVNDNKQRLSEYYDYADKQLYKAKQAGKGTIIQ